ncbi:MAG: 4-hydroxythreonine-4-phosphate dehydrogenase PdxA [Alphaproteobacteria bacterium]|nr:4-hydroxythreonine-4-phosphate dehydrogenase PdxA [Alphaproteobacteria bacterium]
MSAAAPPAPIAITMGDPAGVGPEVTAKAVRDMAPDERARTVVVGSRAALERALVLAGGALHVVPAFAQAPRADAIGIVDVPSPGAVPDGRISREGGETAFRTVKAAVDLALAGRVSVIVTAPLNKAALHAAGHDYDGHTGLLAALSGQKKSYMLLASETLSAVHVSTHVSLEEATRRPTRERVLDTIEAGGRHFRRLGTAQPRIAVAGLNPHSGEGGIFGRQEIETILPAIEEARRRGWTVSGPVPGDTVFYRASRGEFDLVVAQYHDQGHIPVKLIAFDTTVNVTLGLQIQRTSVDHGTAFDIAWQGRADHRNMQAAIAYARRMATIPLDAHPAVA